MDGATLPLSNRRRHADDSNRHYFARSGHPRLDGNHTAERFFAWKKECRESLVYNGGWLGPAIAGRKGTPSNQSDAERSEVIISSGHDNGLE